MAIITIHPHVRKEMTCPHTLPQGDRVRVVEPLHHLLAGLRRTLLVTAPCADGTDITNLPPTSDRSLAALLAGEGADVEAGGKDANVKRKRATTCTRPPNLSGAPFHPLLQVAVWRLC